MLVPSELIDLTRNSAYLIRDEQVHSLDQGPINRPGPAEIDIIGLEGRKL